jgi:predicted phage terminase large subunit-like protein
LFVGGIGSGKTRAGVIEAFRQPPNSTGMIIAPTFPMLREATLETFLELSRSAGILKDFKAGDMTAELLGNRKVIFMSGQNPERLRGPNIGWFMLDEAAMLPEIVWNVMIGRLRRQPARGWAVTTPRGKNWLYKLFTNKDNYAIIKSSTRDNPFLPEGFIDSLMQSYTSEWQAQEIDGEFLDLANAMFKRDWFKRVLAPPEGLLWVRYWDLAASTRTSADYTASVAVAMDDLGNMYVKDGIHVKMEWPDVRKLMVETMIREPDTFHYVEKALHGIAAIQEFMRMPELAHINLQGISVEKDKITRAMPWATRAEQGKLFLVAGQWNEDFIDEVSMFPYGEHDDYVDAVSGTLPMLGSGGKLLLWE